MTITEFLLARIAEDEAAVEVFDGKRWTFDGGEVRDDVTDNPYVPWGRTVLDVGYEGMCQNGLEAHVARHDPARVLAECAAKRAIVNLYEGHRDNRDARRRPRARAAEDEQAARDRRTQEARCRVAEDAMFALAAVYADHPDYLPEWAL